MSLSAIEICAGAGGQALGLELAGFSHELAIELDPTAADTLEANRNWTVKRGDVASLATWDPSDYAEKVDLLAGGVPCPPFSLAGKQLGADDERDLFAWAVETAGVVKPRALLLENVRGLSMPRFSGYRQQIKERLLELGYVSHWKLLQAKDFGVSQLRPRFILVALRPEDAAWFRWPVEQAAPPSVGELLLDLMQANGWPGAKRWSQQASGIAPTIVGGSKKHGGADLGPTRAKLAWAKLGVDGKGIANEAPGPDFPVDGLPRLTLEMVARIQGWTPKLDADWQFSGKKTSQYRQIGNAFPPPVAQAVGEAIRDALDHRYRETGEPFITDSQQQHDEILSLLKSREQWVTESELHSVSSSSSRHVDVSARVAELQKDFVIERLATDAEVAYRFVGFKAFVGQAGHARHDAYMNSLSTIS